MTKICIGSVIEFIPDTAGVREAKLLDLVRDHMGQDMRAVLEDYVVDRESREEALERAEDAEMRCFELNEQLAEARERIEGLLDALEEYKWSRS